jgi:tape measure domain-containing protein
MGNAVSSAKNQIDVFDNLLKRVAARMAAYFAIESVVEFGRSIVDVTRKTELMQNRLAFTFGSLVEAQMAFDRLYRVAQKLGLEFGPLVEGFSKFSIAAKFAGFSARQSEEMFVKVSAGLRAAGASSLQTQRAFLALEQMLSKGVVAAEELRRQLGEALPGAVALMAKAYNKLHPGQEVTIRQFMKLQEEGKIISAEVLPEFANTIEETLGPALAGKAGSLDAAINRLNSSFENIKRTMGMANLTSLTNTIGAFGKRLENIASVIAKPATDQSTDGVFGAIFTLAQAINQLAFGDWLKDAKKANEELEKDYQDLLEAGKNAAIGYATLVSKSAETIDPKNLKSEELIEAMQMITSEFNKIDNATLKKTPEQTKRLATLQIAHGELNALLTERFQKD